MSFEIKAILERESQNNNCIYAYKEGTYWRIYEMSAYALYKIMRKYKPINYIMKELYDGVFYMSLETSDLNKICKRLDLVVNRDNFLQYNCPWISRNEYELWKYNFKLERGTLDPSYLSSLSLDKNMNKSDYNTLKIEEKAQASDSFDMDSLIKEIKSFPMELKTPMECMNWISDIKKMISSY